MMTIKRERHAPAAATSVTISGAEYEALCRLRTKVERLHEAFESADPTEQNRTLVGVFTALADVQRAQGEK